MLLKYVIKSNEINLRIVLNVNLNGNVRDFYVTSGFHKIFMVYFGWYIEIRIKEAVRCSGSKGASNTCQIRYVYKYEKYDEIVCLSMREHNYTLKDHAVFQTKVQARP
ncbi:hypothetical protein RCL_jg26312.t1 [Rhizophagus clarus]|uniref:Uncharacterized protein n=1 Tax=Rhizophagus clarus TaxID=94130 RepID=A0A8H3KY83_9GLOM|nr:hypothetical protein RCL_jg26312.t1 [Rhizophagus clarus]